MLHALWAFLVAPNLLLAQSGLSQLSVTDFSGGLNTRNSSVLLQDNESPSLSNVILDKNYGISRRQGYTRLNASAIGGGSSDVNYVHWLEQSGGNKYCLAFSSTTGYSSTDSCATFTAFVSTLTRNNNVSCANLQDRAYCVNNQYDFYWDGSNDIVFSGPANADFIRVHRNRCFAAGTDATPSRLFWSNLGACQTWTTGTDYVDIDAESGDVITGIGKPFFGLLPIYKKYSTWVLKGVSGDPSTWVLQKMSEHTGALYHRSIDNFGEWQLFDSLGPYGGQPGIYGFNGLIVREFSEKIRPTIEAMDNFKGSTGRRTIDSKVDWDAATFDARTMSSSRESGFMQSSYTTYTDTLGSDFDLGTKTNVSTISTAGSLTMIQSDSGTFTNAGAESNSSTINWETNNFPISQGEGSTSGGIFGSRRWASGIFICAGDVIFRILDISNNTLLERSFSLSSGLNSEFTMDTSGLSQAVIKIYVESRAPGPSLTARSVGFTRPLGVRFVVQDDEPGVNCTIDWDTIESNNITSGTYVSRAFDMGISTPIWGLFNATVSSVAPAALTFEVRSASSSAGAWNAYASQNLGLEIVAASVENRSFLQYRATFSVGATTDTPPAILSADVAAASTGTWLSNTIDLSKTPASWGLFQTVQTVSGEEASIAYCLITCATSPCSTTGTCTSISPGNTITNAVNRYMVIRATYTVGVATETAKTDTIIINWTEGTSATSSTGAVFKNRYHYGAQSDGGSWNDTMFVLDSRGAWTRWTGVLPRHLTTADNKFSMSGSTTATNAGFVYQLYSGDSDDGRAINASWTSKDFSLGDIQNIKSVDRLSLLHNDTAATLTINLQSNAGQYSSSRTKNLDVSQAFGVRHMIVEPSITGNTFRLTLSNNIASEPWDVYGFKLHYRDLGTMEP